MSLGLGSVLYRSTAYDTGRYKDLAHLDYDLSDLSVDNLPDVEKNASGTAHAFI